MSYAACYFLYKALYENKMRHNNAENPSNVYASEQKRNAEKDYIRDMYRVFCEMNRHRCLPSIPEHPQLEEVAIRQKDGHHAEPCKRYSYGLPFPHGFNFRFGK